MKKIISCFLLILMFTSLVACSNSEKTSTKHKQPSITKKDEEAAKQVTLAFLDEVKKDKEITFTATQDTTEGKRISQTYFANVKANENGIVEALGSIYTFLTAGKTVKNEATGKLENKDYGAVDNIKIESIESHEKQNVIVIRLIMDYYNHTQKPYWVELVKENDKWKINCTQSIKSNWPVVMSEKDMDGFGCTSSCGEKPVREKKEAQ